MRTLLILCGGRGKRLGAITRNVPKPLIKIGGKEFIGHLLDSYSRYFDRMVLLAGYMGEKFLNYAGGKVEVEIEGRALGTGGAVLGVLDALPEHFYVCNGDTFLDDFDLKGFVAKCERAGKTTLLLAKDERKAKGSAVLEAGRITKFAEKSGSGEGLVYGGFAFIRKSDLMEWAGRKETSLEKEILPKLAAEGKLFGHLSGSRIYDIGTPKGIRRFKELLGAAKKG